MTTRRLYHDAVDAVFARIGASGNEDWYLTDRLGTIRDILDHTGTSISHRYWDSYGNLVSETGTGSDRYGWTGREVDVETDLQYNRARYYDPTIGRWISEDPIGFDAGDGNLYRYVRNAPAQQQDPLGLQAGNPWQDAEPGEMKWLGGFERRVTRWIEWEREIVNVMGECMLRVTYAEYMWARPVEVLHKKQTRTDPQEIRKAEAQISRLERQMEMAKQRRNAARNRAVIAGTIAAIGAGTATIINGAFLVPDPTALVSGKVFAWALTGLSALIGIYAGLQFAQAAGETRRIEMIAGQMARLERNILKGNLPQLERWVPAHPFKYREIGAWVGPNLTGLKKVVNLPIPQRYCEFPLKFAGFLTRDDFKVPEPPGSDEIVNVK